MPKHCSFILIFFYTMQLICKSWKGVESSDLVLDNQIKGHDLLCKVHFGGVQSPGCIINKSPIALCA